VDGGGGTSEAPVILLNGLCSKKRQLQEMPPS